MDQCGRDQEAKPKPERDGDRAGKRARSADARQRESERGARTRLPLAARRCTRRPKPVSRRKATTMPAEIDAVMRRSSEAAMARANSAMPAAADPSAKGRDERSRSSVRCARIRTAGDTSAARPRGQRTNSTMVRRPANAAVRSGRGWGSIASVDRERIPVDRGDRDGRQRADDEAERDAERSEEQRLDHVDGEHEAARGAEAFEGGDDLALLGHVAPDRVADADAAEQEGGEPDEIDELGEAVGIAAERGGGIGPVVDGKTALRGSAVSMSLRASASACLSEAAGSGSFSR